MNAGDADAILIQPTKRRPGGVQLDLTLLQVDAIVRALTYEAIPHFGAGAVLWQFVRALMRRNSPWSNRPLFHRVFSR